MALVILHTECRFDDDDEDDGDDDDDGGEFDW